MKQRFLPITFFSSSRATGRQPFFEVNFFRGSHPEHVLSPLSNSLDIDQMFHTNVFRYRVSTPGTTAKCQRWYEFEVVKISDTTLRRWSIDQDSAGLHCCCMFCHFFFLIHIDIQRRGMSISTVSYKLFCFCDRFVECFCLVHGKYRRKFLVCKLFTDIYRFYFTDQDLGSAGTVTPAISAIVAAFCPTILAFSAPLIRIVFLLFQSHLSSGSSILYTEILL